MHVIHIYAIKSVFFYFTDNVDLPMCSSCSECVDIFCNSSAKTASSLIILLLCFLLLEI